MSRCTKNCHEVFHMTGGYHRTDCELGNTLDGRFLPENTDKKYTEAELQEKLRQQREACMKAAWNYVKVRDPLWTIYDLCLLREVILTEKIDD